MASSPDSTAPLHVKTLLRRVMEAKSRPRGGVRTMAVAAHTAGDTLDPAISALTCYSRVREAEAVAECYRCSSHSPARRTSQLSVGA